MPGCVGKVLRILTAISESENQPVMLGTIAEATQMPKSTCARIVSEMMEEGYVDRVSREEGYRLGPVAYRLRCRGNYNGELSAACHPVLKSLHNKTGLCGGLAAVQNGKFFIIDYLDTNPKTVTWQYGSPVTFGETLLTRIGKLKSIGVFRISEKAAGNECEQQVGWSTGVYQKDNCVGLIMVFASSLNRTMEMALAKEDEIKNLILRAGVEVNRRLADKRTETLTH